MKLKFLQKLKSALLLLGLCTIGNSAKSQTYTFTTAGATGINGPSQTQVNTAYASTNLAGNVTVTGGIQSWSIPVSGLYKIEVYGANGYGPFAGRGAYMSGEFNFNASDGLKILVGQQGGCCVAAGTEQYGGGGGTFVVTSTNTPLIIAGGGGGANGVTSIQANSDASITTAGNAGVGTTAGSAGGTNGSGGLGVANAGGGGGFLGDGGVTAGDPGGFAFLNGGGGGTAVTAGGGGWGGFGGGGGANSWNNRRGGGGGGYSGGGGAGSSTSVAQIGGGGGSYNSGNNQINTPGLGTGNGLVVITLLQQAVSLPNNVGVVGFPSLSGSICPGNQTVSVKIRNFGNNFISIAKIGWEVNGILQTDNFYSVAIDTFPAPGYDTTIILGTYNFASGAQTLKAWTSFPNLLVDPLNNNDTSTISVTPKLGGSFTLNSAQATGGTNYQTFTAFVNDLTTHGVCAPVVLNVANGSGPYSEQISIPQVVGVNSTNTITINGNGATLTYAATLSTAPSTLELNGADYITINNLNIVGTGATYALACHLWNQADNNNFNNCTFTSPSTGTGTVLVPFSISGSATSATTTGLSGNNNVISGCTMDGGYYNTVFYGNSSGANTGNQLINCSVKDFYAYGIYCYYQNGIIISGNTVERPTRSAVIATSYGIFITTACVGVLVEKNRVRNLFGGVPTSTSTAYAIYSAIDGTLGNENRYYNNLIYDMNGNGILGGLYLTGADYIKVYHNTVSMDNTASTATTATYGIYSTGTIGGIDIKNNIVTISRGGTGTKYCLYFTGGSQSCNYNNLFMNAASGTANYIGFFTSTNHTSLTSWKTANGGIWDQASVSANPQYANAATGDFTLTNLAVDNLGTPVGVLNDILGNPRDPVVPDLGAFELPNAPCTSPPNAGNATANPSSGLCPGSNISMSLTGFIGGSGQTYQWQEAAVLAGPYSNVSSLSVSPSATITATTSKYFRCAVTCGVSTSFSDTIYVSVNPAIMTGTYTINNALPTGGTNFSSFTDAVTTMSSCGIPGPIVFNVVTGSGPYVEQVTVPAILGASATNTITINGNGATLRFAGNATDLHTLGLNGADYVTVNNLNIEGTDGTYGLVCHLWNGADNNTFSNCTFTVTSTTGTATTLSPFSLSGASATAIATAGTSGNNNVVTGCTMIGGFYATAFTGSASTGINTGNQLINCNLKDFQSYGVYNNYQNGIVIRGNTIERPTRTTLTSFYGVFNTTGCTNALVERNRIRHPYAAALTSTALAYGLYSNISATSGNENKYYNNLISDFNGNGVMAGIYVTGTYAKIYHNTISIDQTNAIPTGQTYGIWLSSTSATTGHDVKNNLIHINRGGTGAKQCLLYGSASVLSNNNDLFIFPASGTNYTGYFGSGFNTLAAWQTANSGAWDGLSKNLNPLFTDPSTGNYTPKEWLLDNAGVNVNITADILGNPRSTTPDPGAYEFSAPSCTAPPSAGTVSASPAEICGGSSTYLYLTGQSTGNGQTIQWQYYDNGTSAWVSIPGATSPNYSPSPTTNTEYRAAVTCNSNTQTSDTVKVYVFNQVTAGTYTINKALPTGGNNFNSFTHAAANLSCGISGPVVINVVQGSGPYNEQATFRTIPGSSTTNTVTINGNSNLLTYGAGTIDQAHTLRLEGTDYLIVNDLNIENTSATYAFACHLWNGADNNTFSNCTFTVSPTATVNTVVPFVLSGSLTSSNGQGVSGNNNLITGCTMDGGYYGITTVGSSAAPNTGNQIINCTIRDWYTTGPYAIYQNGLVVRGNIIERPTRTNTTTAYGVYIITGCTNSLVEGNRIRNIFGALPTSTNIFYGIYSNIDATLGNENRYYNNLISDIKGNGTQGGIYLLGADYVKVYHNTIAFDYTAATAGITYGIYSTGTVGGNDIMNNIVTIRRGGSGVKYCLYFAGIQSSNNNVLYISPNPGVHNVGFFGTDFATLSAWQAANSPAWDAQSKFIDPLYANPTGNDYTPTEWQTDNMGVNVGVASDILGTPRSGSSPDPGAYEFSVPACTLSLVPGTASVNVVNTCAGNTLNFSLTGQSVGTGIIYQWQNYDQGMSSWVNIAGATNTTYNTTASTTTQYRMAVTCQTSTAYSDTLKVNVVPMFVSSGAYTLNSLLPTGGTNFATIYELDSALLCGLSGALTINVNPAGTYSGQLHFRNMGSVSAPIAFNGNGATFTYNPTADLDRACIKLDNADYVTINNLNIVSPTSSLYGYGIQMINDADNNTISGCNISCDISVTPNTHCGIVISGSHNAPNTVGSNCDSVTITGCTINGGIYGISCFGNGLTAMIHGAKITNNTILNPYSVGIYLNGNNYALVQGNNISRPDRTNSTTIQGILLAGGNTNNLVNANKVHNLFGSFHSSSNTMYGIVYQNPGLQGSPCTISNNLIYDQKTTRGIQYGFYNNAGTYVNYYHNTVILDNNSGSLATVSTAGLFSTGASGNIDLKNNLFKITRSGTGIIAGIYFNTVGTVFTSDYNNIYVNAATGTNIIGYSNSTAYNTLSAWQASTGSPDMNSTSIDPMFPSPWALVPEGLNNTGTPIPGVTTDVNSTSRNVSTPDVGAIEYTPLPCSPTVSVSANNITTTSADIIWSTVSGATGYEYAITSSSTLPVSGTAITGTTLPLSGLTPSTYYYVHIRSNCGANGFSNWAGMRFATRPLNDDCVNSLDISSGALFAGSTIGATQTMAAGACATTTGFTNDVWYHFTTTQPTNTTISATNLIGDLVMETYSGTCGSLTSLDCQDSPSIGTEITTLNNLPAGTYYVRIHGFLSVENPFTIQVTTVPLSIGLIDISAVNAGLRNRVIWNTANEDDGDYFMLERGHDGRDFSPITAINSKGEASSYTYWDESPENGMNYYRLKMIDKQGAFAYSKTVSAFVIDESGFSIKAYPNPVEEMLTVKLFGEAGNNPVIMLTDVRGSVIKTAVVTNNESTIDMRPMAHGVYFVKYMDSKHSETIKIRK